MSKNVILSIILLSTFAVSIICGTAIPYAIHENKNNKVPLYTDIPVQSTIETSSGCINCYVKQENKIFGTLVGNERWLIDFPETLFAHNSPPNISIFPSFTPEHQNRFWIPGGKIGTSICLVFSDEKYILYL